MGLIFSVWKSGNILYDNSQIYPLDIKDKTQLTIQEQNVCVCRGGEYQVKKAILSFPSITFLSKSDLMWECDPRARVFSFMLDIIKMAILGL